MSIPAHRINKGCDPYHTAAKLQLIDNVEVFYFHVCILYYALALFSLGVLSHEPVSTNRTNVSLDSE